EYTTLPDVVLVTVDSAVSAVDLAAGTMQVARGSVMTDASGTRRVTLLFPPGTTSQVVFPNGSTQPLTSLHVRATEFTARPNGHQARPADVPPNSAYTYAATFLVDEARAAGAVDVRFNPPLPVYLENFLNFPFGVGVPLGAYDPDLGQWVPSTSGVVVK